MNKYIEILQKEIHSVFMASVDEEGFPVTNVIDIMLADENGMYFLTGKGKSFYDCLMRQEFAAISGMISGSNDQTEYETMNRISVSFRGKLKNIGKNRLDELFDANPYMFEIFPTKESRESLEVFQIYEGVGEAFDLSVKPPMRESFKLGDTIIQKSGYHITEKCMGCQNCVKKCPSGCIDKGAPFKIREENCLHCGNCYYVCPFHAVEKY